MGFRRIGIMSPGDMGQAIGAQLKAAGYDVCTALDARSDRSRAPRPRRRGIGNQNRAMVDASSQTNFARGWLKATLADANRNCRQTVMPPGV